MSELVTPSAEPSYLVPLALNTAPFGPTNDDGFFFRGEQIEQRFNLLLHLIRASDKVALLFAHQGLGKSTLLMQLQQAMGDDIRLCRINGKTLLEPAALTIHCLRELDVDEQEIQLSTDHNGLLRQRCQQLQSLNVKPLVLIDDIDALPAASISTIMDWLSWREDEQFSLQAVLTAKSLMQELKTVHGRVQRIDLPALAENELNIYLNHRLSAAGYQGQSLFKAKALKQIFKQSLGNPELINQLAHQQLLGVKPISAGNKFKLSKIFKWSGIALVTVLFAILLAFQDKVNALFITTKSDVELDKVTEFISDQTITTVVADENDKQDESEPEILEVITDASPSTATEAGKGKEVPELNTEQQARMELESLIAEIPVTAPVVIKSEADKIADEITVSSNINAEENRPINLKRDWVLKQDSNHYTFQLMGSWEREKVVDFIDKYKLTGDLAIFESERSGQVWYALIYGVFEDKESALKISDTWPTTLKTLPKWLRQFDSVQQQIQK